MKTFKAFLAEEELSVKESPYNKKRRMSSGYKHIAHIDARKFKDQYEKEHGQKLDWNPSRLERLKNVSVLDDHPKVYKRDFDGKLDVLDGRHRIATAAYAGKTIRVATPKNKKVPDHLLAKD